MMPTKCHKTIKALDLRSISDSPGPRDGDVRARDSIRDCWCSRLWGA